MKKNNYQEPQSAQEIKSEQYKNFISGLKVLATKYNITHAESLNAAREAFTKAYKYEYFFEPYIEITENKQSRKLIITAYQIVVENLDEIDNDGLISLEEALKIDPNAKVGDHILMDSDNAPDVNFADWSRKTINIFNQTLIQKCKEIERKNIIANYSSKIGTLTRGTIDGINNSGSGYIVKLIDGNTAFLPKSLCSPADDLRVSKTASIKFLIQAVSNGEKFIEYPILLSRNSAKFVIELFNEVIPEIKDKLITILAGARISGVRTKLLAQSHNQYVHVVGAFLGQNEERMNVIRKEITNERIEIIQWNSDKSATIRNIIRHIEPVFFAQDMLLNEKTGISVLTNFIVVNDADLGRTVGPKWINIELLKKAFNEPWTAITLTDAKIRGLKASDESISWNKTASLPKAPVIKKMNDIIEPQLNDSELEKTQNIILEEVILPKKVIESKTKESTTPKKSTKVDFKNIEINKQEKVFGLEAKLAEESHAKNKKPSGNKFKYGKPIFKPNSAAKKDSTLEQEQLNLQNQILKEKWAQNQNNIINDLDDDITEDFDEAIDLNNYDNFYD